MTDTPYHIQVHGVDALQPATWAALTEGIEGTVFQSQAFLSTWVRTIGAARGSAVHIVQVCDGAGRSVLVLPLCSEAHAGARILRFMDGGVADANAPLICRQQLVDAAIVQQIWPQILAQLPRVDAVDFSKIPEQINGLRNPFYGVSLGANAPQLHSSTGNLVLMPQGWDGYIRDQELSKALKLQRKKMRQCEALAPVRYMVAKTPEQMQHFLQRLLDLKGQQFIESYGQNLFENHGIGAFYQKCLVPDAQPLASMRAICVGDEIAALAFGFLGTDRFHFVLTTYDPKFSRYSLGTQLLIEMLQDAAAQGQTVFDLGEGNLPYKDTWVSERVALCDYHAPLTLRGHLYFVLKAIKHHPWISALRQMARRIRS